MHLLFGGSANSRVAVLTDFLTDTFYQSGLLTGPCCQPLAQLSRAALLLQAPPDLPIVEYVLSVSMLCVLVLQRSNNAHTLW